MPNIWTPSDAQRKRWRDLTRRQLRHGDCIINFSRLGASQKKEFLEFSGMLSEQRGCPHFEYKGFDVTPGNTEWRCTYCGRVDDGKMIYTKTIFA